jgi:hypothetical protein
MRHGSSERGELAQSQAGRLRHLLNLHPVTCPLHPFEPAVLWRRILAPHPPGELAQSQAGRLRHLLNITDGLLAPPFKHVHPDASILF